MSLFRSLPPFRADVVGSYLRPESLTQARIDFEKGLVSAQALRAEEDKAIRHSVERQRACGLQVVTDGEFRRTWWHFDFSAGLGGVERYDTDEGIQFAGVQTRSHNVRVIGKVSFGDHPMLKDFEFLQSLDSGATPKITIPSPRDRKSVV